MKGLFALDLYSSCVVLTNAFGKCNRRQSHTIRRDLNENAWSSGLIHVRDNHHMSECVGDTQHVFEYMGCVKSFSLRCGYGI